MSSHHFVTVCVVCVLCATHTPCSAHTDVSSSALTSSWDSSDPLEVIETSWIDERSSGSPDSTGGSKPKEFAAFDVVRRVKEPKRTQPKKYSHSYSEEKASRKAAKIDESIDDTPHRPEVLERLGQLPEGSIVARASSNVDSSSTKVPRLRRGAEIDEKYFTKKLFDAYGDGTSLSIEGFEKLLKKLGLFRLIENIEKFDNSNVLENRGNSKKGKNDCRVVYIL